MKIYLNLIHNFWNFELYFDEIINNNHRFLLLNIVEYLYNVELIYTDYLTSQNEILFELKLYYWCRLTKRKFVQLRRYSKRHLYKAVLFKRSSS
jgi:hypothetical protein